MSSPDSRRPAPTRSDPAPSEPGPWQLHPQLAADTHAVASLALSECRLMEDANHPWLILVPRVPGACELVDLAPEAQAELLREIRCASLALRQLFAPRKLNVAALGNVVAQLHVHVIARFEHDAAWPRPVWGAAPPRPYTEVERARRIDALRTALR